MSDLQKVFESMKFDVSKEDTKYNSRVLFIDALNTFLRSYAAIPTLAQGEIGYETDTTKFKIGDGSTAWSSLAYAYAASARQCPL